MKPKLLKAFTDSENSFSVRHESIPSNNNRWHYHQEVEIIHFKKGRGTLFIGDSINEFKDGDIIIIGANLPHYCRFDDQYLESDCQNCADMTIVHFSENFWGNQFLQLYENRGIKMILEKARRGLLISNECSVTATLLKKLLVSAGAERVMLLLKTLMSIASCKQLKLLSSIGFKYDYKESENDRIKAIYEYTIANFRSKIKLDEVAAIAHICPNSFCRYFKSRTKKTYSQFLIEIKVGHACKLLIENKLSIKQLCSESGFNSFSGFHKYFKRITGISPAIYKSEFVKRTKNNFSVVPMHVYHN